MDGEGRGKTVGIRQFVFRSQFGCAASQFEIGVHDFERQLCDIIQDFLRDPLGFGLSRLPRQIAARSGLGASRCISYRHAPGLLHFRYTSRPDRGGEMELSSTKMCHQDNSQPD